MNRLIILMLFVMIFLGCEKKEGISVVAPDWLNIMINDMESESTYIAAEFWSYKWNDEYVYELTSPIFSCLYCNVFDSRGNRIEWEKADIDDFLANHTDKTFIWKEPELN